MVPADNGKTKVLSLSRSIKSSYIYIYTFSQVTNRRYRWEMEMFKLIVAFLLRSMIFFFFKLSQIFSACSI